MADDELRRWARKADFPDPPDWGAIEERIHSEPVPPQAELERDYGRTGRGHTLPLVLLVAPQALFSSGISLVGLGLVVAHLGSDAPLPEWLEAAARLVFLAAIIATFVPVLMWMSTKRRGLFQVLTSGGTAAVSAVSVVLLSASSPTGAWSTYRTMAAIAVLTGLAVLVFLFLVAKPGVRMTWRERVSRPSPEDQWLRGQRALLLEVLAKRGLVSSWDITDLMTLPRGAWRELESLPDGRVVRRRT